MRAANVLAGLRFRALAAAFAAVTWAAVASAAEAPAGSPAGATSGAMAGSPPGGTAGSTSGAPAQATAGKPAGAPAVATLAVQDAWVRVTPGTDMAAAYLTLRNDGAEAITVTGIQSPLAGHAMIHETRVQGGQSRMRPHEQVVVPAKSVVKFQPGGLHVMLHDLKQQLIVGQAVPLVISLSTGSTLQVSAPVKPLTAE